MTFCLFRKNHLAMKYIQNGNQFHLLECYLNKHQNLTHLNDKIGKCKFYLQLEKKKVILLEKKTRFYSINETIGFHLL